MIFVNLLTFTAAFVIFFYGLVGEEPIPGAIITEWRNGFLIRSSPLTQNFCAGS
jgi:hypothetical protein